MQASKGVSRPWIGLWDSLPGLAGDDDDAYLRCYGTLHTKAFPLW